MNSYFTRQSQFELFPETQNETMKETRSGFSFTRLTLSLENLIVLGVVLIVGLVLSFSLGVEKGKRLAFTPAKKQDSTQFQNTPAVIKEDSVEFSSPESANENTAPSDNQLITQESNVDVVAQNKENDPLVTVQAAQADLQADLEKTIDKLYTIQVASFKKESYAQKAATDLKEKGYKKHEIVVLNKGDYSIVCIGKFIEKKEANVFAKELKKRYKDCLVRSL